MSAQISEFYSQIDLAIQQARTAYEIVDLERKKVADADLDVDHNWSDILFQMQSTIDGLYLLAGVAQFERVSKEKMLQILTAASNGNSSGKTTISVTHNLADYETLRTLELKYGISWERILEYNRMTISDFQSATSVEIPLLTDIQNPGNQDIPVFGDQTGTNILGTDLDPDLDVDSDGDLAAQSPEDSFQQWADTVSQSRKGDFPFYEDFGMDLVFSEDLPSEAIESMLQLRIAEAFSSDPRIADVQIDNIVRQGNTIQATTTLTSIKGQTFETIV